MLHDTTNCTRSLNLSRGPPLLQMATGVARSLVVSCCSSSGRCCSVVVVARWLFFYSLSRHSFPNEMHLLCSRGLFLLRIESPLCSFIVLYLFALGELIWIAVSRDIRLDWRRKAKYTRTLYSLLLLYNTFQFIPKCLTNVFNRLKRTISKYMLF